MAKLNRVLDASGINRSTHDYSEGGFALPASVLGELREETSRLAVEEAVRKGDIKVLTPGAGSLKKALTAAKETGDIASLSQPDLDVIALAVENGLPIVSDDYAIQNTAAKLGIKVTATSQETIRRTITWAWACTGCGSKMQGPGNCGICGHRAGKKPA